MRKRVLRTGTSDRATDVFDATIFRLLERNKKKQKQSNKRVERVRSSEGAKEIRMGITLNEG